MKIDPIDIILKFYPDDTPQRQMLLKHRRQVRDKALEILRSLPPENAENGELDPDTVAAGAMLHDIGICRCYAPGILCNGPEPYLAHGIIGAGMIRQLDPELEVFARICERHTGSGLTADEIRCQNLPIPEQDYLPETKCEKLICLADKFFSKSGDMKEKSISHIRKSMEKFGAGPMKRFDDLMKEFNLIR